MINDLLILIISILIIGLSYKFIFSSTKNNKKIEVTKKDIENKRNELLKELNNKKKDNEEKRIQEELTRKEQLKEQKKQEKKQRQEEQRKLLEEKKKRMEELEKIKRDKELKEQKIEIIEKEKEIAKELELKKKEEEEYNKWKDAFEIEDSGNIKEEDNYDINFFEQFINFIKIRKVVLIEDISNRFKLKNKDVIERINSLIQNGTLNGVLDDKGKFIYISNSEIDNLISILNNKGRITRSEMVIEFSKIIKMEPTEEDKKILKLEEDNILNTFKNELLIDNN